MMELTMIQFKIQILDNLVFIFLKNTIKFNYY